MESVAAVAATVAWGLAGETADEELVVIALALVAVAAWAQGVSSKAERRPGVSTSPAIGVVGVDIHQPGLPDAQSVDLASVT